MRDHPALTPLAHRRRLRPGWPSIRTAASDRSAALARQSFRSYRLDPGRSGATGLARLPAIPECSRLAPRRRAVVMRRRAGRPMALMCATAMAGWTATGRRSDRRRAGPAPEREPAGSPALRSVPDPTGPQSRPGWPRRGRTARERMPGWQQATGRRLAGLASVDLRPTSVQVPCQARSRVPCALRQACRAVAPGLRASRRAGQLADRSATVTPAHHYQRSAAQEFRNGGRPKRKGTDPLVLSVAASS